jgi:hypothetical protein
VIVLGSRLAHSPPPALDWFAIGTCALITATFLWPTDFYYHYAAFLAPFLALALALPASRLLAALPARGRARLTWLPDAAMMSAVSTIVVLTMFQAIVESHNHTSVAPAEIAVARRLIPPGACVVTDQASYTIAIDRFVSSVPGCSLMIDAMGTNFALSDGRTPQTGADSSAAVEAAWMSAFRAATYAWLTTEAYRRIPWTPRLAAYFVHHFVPLTYGPDFLFIRSMPRPYLS